MRRLSVVIVNFRTPDLALGALQSLAFELDPRIDGAVVVDNDSGDGSADRIEAEIASRGWSWASVARSPLNGGFSFGNNFGMQAAPANDYLLLNSDAYVRPGAIACLLARAGATPRAGLLSPRLEWPDGTRQDSCFRFRTPASEAIEAAGTSVVTRLLARWELPVRPDGEACEVPWTSFACVLLRDSLLRAIGPMDDGYFMYFDDIDYCRRAWGAGFSVVHEPAARVVHLRGGTSPLKASAAARRPLPGYYYHARARYFAKHFGRSGLWAANACWCAGRAISFARERFAGKPPHTSRGAELEVWRHAWRPIAKYAPPAPGRR